MLPIFLSLSVYPGLWSEVLAAVTFPHLLPNPSGLVETSLNMGIVSLKNDKAVVQFSVRSSLESAKRALIGKPMEIHSSPGILAENSPHSKPA